MSASTNVMSENANMDHSVSPYSVMDACESQREDFEVLVGEIRDSFGHYLGKRPMLASTLVFLAGFYVGWRIKPW